LLEWVLQSPPGALVQCGPDGVTVEDYWDLRFVSSNSLGEAEWTRRVQDRLQDAVSSHLVSDVPFGAFLSGGIDSSAVVAMMTRALDAPVSTFSIDFEEQSFSEARYAQVVAERYRSDHHVITARADVVELLESLIWYADDPLADSSMIPVYLIAEFARKFVTMVLTGDGGDEVFAGYETYNAYYARKLYRKLPSFVRRQIVRRVVETLPVSMTKVSFDFKAKRFVAGAELDEEEAHFWWRIIFSENAKSSLYTDRFRETISAPPTAEVYRSYFGRSGTDDPLSRMLYVDTRFYLPADMLEARVPFLDHQLVEFAATIPSSIKFKNRKKKYVLKKALEPLLSDDILYRKKAGFNVPVNEWLTGPLREYARGVLAPDRIGEAGVFDPGVVWRLLEEHEQRRFDHSFQLWGLICFQLWYERFVAAPQVVPPSRVAERWGILAP
jgi:asparagine synthase (glutamine-hydrolysing)